VPPSVLLILDGASEPLARSSTSLEQARTPCLDGLVLRGELLRIQTVPCGLPAGSETAIPGLLGAVPTGVVDRGAVEAAARGLGAREGERAWRLDVWVAGERADALRAADLATKLAGRLNESSGRPGSVASPSRFAVRALSGHRLLLVGPPPLPAWLAAGAAFDEAVVTAWPEGIIPRRVLDRNTVVVAARGAAAGVAALMGARVLVPPRATGRPGSDLAAKSATACAEIVAGAPRVVVHIGGADEAAHDLDAVGKVRVLEQVDREVLAPLWRAVRAAGGFLTVCPDHGCDPTTGLHDAGPVPCLRVDSWRGAPPAPATGASRRPLRFTERSVAGLPVLDIATIRLLESAPQLAQDASTPAFTVAAGASA
jgi:2,3-bisphosphoglycerate-independent phosphoglycerate mutase